jgi:hypothetical protein
MKRMSHGEHGGTEEEIIPPGVLCALCGRLPLREILKKVPQVRHKK